MASINVVGHVMFSKSKALSKAKKDEFLAAAGNGNKWVVEVQIGGQTLRVPIKVMGKEQEGSLGGSFSLRDAEFKLVREEAGADDNVLPTIDLDLA